MTPDSGTILIAGNNMSAATKREWTKIRLEVKKYNKAAVMVTHDERVQDLADRVYRLENGRLSPAYCKNFSLQGIKEERFGWIAFCVS